MIEHTDNLRVHSFVTHKIFLTYQVILFNFFVQNIDEYQNMLKFNFNFLVIH